ncbi:MAG: hybrid sensor histidine kinase/response regulator, partial [Verrucomicrobiaceae bacterium]|nr:hybrid sensor histidine kinase/response regulator [Verrucomicrobiaceae bacterium]
RFLSQLGSAFTLVEADKISVALERYREIRPHVVLLDQHLPDGNGLDLLATLQRENDGGTAFVMLTASDQPGTGLEVMRMGAHDYLIKGKIGAGDLQRAITNALEKASLAREIATQRRVLVEKNAALENELAARRETERLLRQSQALSQSILDASGDCIKVLDLDASILSVNAAGLRLMEIDDFTLYLGRSWFDFWPGNPEVNTAFKLACNGGEGRFQGALATIKGAEKWWDVLISPIFGADGKPASLVAISRDISQTRLDERKLRDAFAAADSANRAKDDFLAALSHELRTPLNPVLLLASEGEKDGSLSEETRGDFAAIRKNIELEARLIDDLLDLTRISRGKMRLEFARIDLHKSLRESWDLLRSDIANKQLHLRLTFAPCEIWVDADPLRLQQVFWNIIKNAVRFTPRDGEISITTSIDDESGHVRIAIADTGVGIAADELDRIFSSFDQGREGHRFGGLGLGLAIARGLVDLHGGTIAASSPGLHLGATFAIELPQASAASAQAASQPSAAHQAMPSLLHILLVEDHVITRETLARLLLRRGHVVATAGSLAEALEVGSSFPCEIVLSDLGLPDGSGHQVLEGLRQWWPFCRGIALSGYGMDSDMQNSIEAGYDFHLNKPVSIQKLDATIQSLAVLLRNPVLKVS